MIRKQDRNIFAVRSAWEENMPGSDGKVPDGQDPNSPPVAKTPPPPPGVNEDRVKSIVTDAMKNIRTEFSKSVSDAVTPITEQLEGFAEVLRALRPPEAVHRDPAAPDPQLTARLLDTEKTSKALKEQVERLQKENEEARHQAERADRHSRIRSALSSFQFVSDDAAETAFNLMEREIRRDGETGNLIAGPEGRVLPFDVYCKETLNSKHAYLLGTKAVSGAGATRGEAKYTGGGSGGGQNGSGLVGTTEMIRPGMRKEERDAVIAQIAHVAAQLGR